MSQALRAEAIAAIEQQIRAACDAATWEMAATIAIRGYGPELLGYLNALLRDPAEADDVFAAACEHLWSGLSGFAWQSSFRTWAYTITRNAWVSFMRGARKRRGLPLSSAPLAALAADVRSQTATFMRTGTKDRFAEIREGLDPDDQTLLILRIDRGLPYRDIAIILDADAAALRKRFERLKLDLKEKLVKAQPPPRRQADSG
jgi:RNA polymerase sigma-70 factor (ECF subfamily)